jgi:hypothetical protein
VGKARAPQPRPVQPSLFEVPAPAVGPPPWLLMLALPYVEAHAVLHGAPLRRSWAPQRAYTIRWLALLATAAAGAEVIGAAPWGGAIEYRHHVEWQLGQAVVLDPPLPWGWRGPEVLQPCPRVVELALRPLGVHPG